MPAMEMDLKLVQLMAYTDWNETMTYLGDKATPYSYDWMFEAGGMEKVATYAEGIGPWKPMLVSISRSTLALLAPSVFGHVSLVLSC